MLNLSGQELELDRFPRNQSTRSLQAWDSADEYILSYWNENQCDFVRPLILNDSFGALTCAFHHLNPVVSGDSFVGECGLLANLSANGLDTDAVTLLDSYAEWPTDTDVVFLKLPKSNVMLEHLLQRLTHLHQGVQVIAAGKAKDVTSSVMKLFEKYLVNTRTSLAKKKSRLIFAEIPEQAKSSDMTRRWELTSRKFQISNDANVFSGGSLDIGGALLLANIPSQQQGRLIDLGCGNGVIGLALLADNPDATVVFVDESYMALTSSRNNVTSNLADELDRAEFIIDDCLSKADKESADWIVCNPPFHQHKAVSDHIAWQMFKDALRVLKPGGILRIVANRHLGHEEKLKRLFGNCKVQDSNPKFVIMDAKKR